MSEAGQHDSCGAHQQRCPQEDDKRCIVCKKVLTASVIKTITSDLSEHADLVPAGLGKSSQAAVLPNYTLGGLQLQAFHILSMHDLIYNAGPWGCSRREFIINGPV